MLLTLLRFLGLGGIRSTTGIVVFLEAEIVSIVLESSLPEELVSTLSSPELIG